MGTSWPLILSPNGVPCLSTATTQARKRRDANQMRRRRTRHSDLLPQAGKDTPGCQGGIAVTTYAARSWSAADAHEQSWPMRLGDRPADYEEPLGKHRQP